MPPAITGRGMALPSLLVLSLPSGLMISLIFSTRHFLQSILLIIIDVAIFIFAFKIPALFILFPLISGFCHAKVYQKIFAKIIDARDEENNESNMVQE